MTTVTGFTQLAHEGLLAVQGMDASKFLQGQLTCNLNYVAHDRSSLGARCNAKGRVQSTFRLVQQGDGYVLAMPTSIVEQQLEQLKKFAIFSKVTLSDDSQAWVRFGLINGEQVLSALSIELPQTTNAVTQHNNMLAIRISATLCELWLPPEQASCTTKKIADLITPVSNNEWQLELIRCGIGHVSEHNVERFIPQMLNLPALDAVSFKKGCYTGQEIVARMQFLGKLKRHMFRFTAATQQLPELGTSLLDAQSDAAVGEVISAARHDAGIELLAVALDDAVANADLRLGSSEGEQLTVAALPYDINTERELLR